MMYWEHHPEDVFEPDLSMFRRLDLLGRPMRDIVLVDLDSTTCLTSKRHHLAVTSDPTSTWATYAQACESDDPALGVVAVTNMLYRIALVHHVSGRDSSAYPQTRRWMTAKGVLTDHVELMNYEKLGDPDFSSTTFKVRYVQQLRRMGYSVRVFFEDWHGVAEGLEAIDVPVVLVNPNYPKYRVDSSAGPEAQHMPTHL
jgi:hypothetical protein